MKTSEVLRNALALFGPDGQKWIDRCPPPSKHCSVTAIYAAANTGREVSDCMDALYGAADVSAFSWLGAWNDNHTWPEVKAAFEKAIAVELAKEAA